MLRADVEVSKPAATSTAEGELFGLPDRVMAASPATVSICWLEIVLSPFTDISPPVSVMSPEGVSCPPFKELPPLKGQLASGHIERNTGQSCVVVDAGDGDLSACQRERIRCQTAPLGQVDRTVLHGERVRCQGTPIAEIQRAALHEDGQSRSCRACIAEREARFYGEGTAIEGKTAGGDIVRGLIREGIEKRIHRQGCPAVDGDARIRPRGRCLDGPSAGGWPHDQQARDGKRAEGVP